jgi:single stranded DNA-binding protein
MALVNKVILTGKVGKNPLIKVMPTKTYARFILFVLGAKRQPDGTFIKVRHSIPCFWMNDSNDKINITIKPGAKVLVVGRLDTNRYQDKEGRMQYALTVVSESVTVVDSYTEGTDDEWE